LTNERYNLDKVVKQIKVGDVVKLDNKEESKIEGFEILPEINTQTYIITVEDNHNFYANNILVHNK
jgi:intein/homing endonuclease